MNADGLPPPPEAAHVLFGKRLPLAIQYAELLATAGIERGLLGPQEVPRLWERHLVNCALVTDLLPPNVRVVDIGTGAGLPGIAIACRRADVRVDLVESMQRRVRFLTDVVHALGLTAQMRVFEGRAEARAIQREVGSADWATARAVAPLDRLVRLVLPLLRAGGVLLAIKGERSATELATHRAAILRAGGTDLQVLVCERNLPGARTRVVHVRRR